MTFPQWANHRLFSVGLQDFDRPTQIVLPETSLDEDLNKRIRFIALTNHTEAHIAASTGLGAAWILELSGGSPTNVLLSPVPAEGDTKEFARHYDTWYCPFTHGKGFTHLKPGEMIPVHSAPHSSLWLDIFRVSVRAHSEETDLASILTRALLAINERRGQGYGAGSTTTQWTLCVPTVLLRDTPEATRAISIRNAVRAARHTMERVRDTGGHLVNITFVASDRFHMTDGASTTVIDMRALETSGLMYFPHAVPISRVRRLFDAVLRVWSGTPAVAFELRGANDNDVKEGKAALPPLVRLLVRRMVISLMLQTMVDRGRHFDYLLTILQHGWRRAGEPADSGEVRFWQFLHERRRAVASKIEALFPASRAGIIESKSQFAEYRDPLCALTLPSRARERPYAFRALRDKEIPWEDLEDMRKNQDVDMGVVSEFLSLFETCHGNVQILGYGVDFRKYRELPGYMSGDAGGYAVRLQFRASEGVTSTRQVSPGIIDLTDEKRQVQQKLEQPEQPQRREKRELSHLQAFVRLPDGHVVHIDGEQRGMIHGDRTHAYARQFFPEKSVFYSLRFERQRGLECVVIALAYTSAILFGGLDTLEKVKGTLERGEGRRMIHLSHFGPQLYTMLRRWRPFTFLTAAA